MSADSFNIFDVLVKWVRTLQPWERCAFGKLAEIEALVPAYEKQVWFNLLWAKVRELSNAQQEAEIELNAMLPSILDKAFKGEL